MIRSFITDREEFIHLFDQMNKFLFYKRIKTFFRVNEISSLVDDCFIEWKTSLNRYSVILGEFFDNCGFDFNIVGFYHDIPEIEILTKSENVKYQSNGSYYTAVHVIEGSITVSILENENLKYDKVLENSELIVFPSDCEVILKKLNTKKVCISSMGINYVQNNSCNECE
jgi:hypothetical protein